MLTTPPKTEAAFRALLAALDAEVEELQGAAQHRFHSDGLPDSARSLTHAAIHRRGIRDDIARIYEKWRAAFPPLPPSPVPPVSSAPRGSLTLPKVRVAHPMTHNEAARRLGVSAEKIRGWLESGLLKGQQLTRTKWQVDAQEVLRFAREHRDLL